jgi:hypothetical protein
MSSRLLCRCPNLRFTSCFWPRSSTTVTCNSFGSPSRGSFGTTKLSLLSVAVCARKGDGEHGPTTFFVQAREEALQFFPEKGKEEEDVHEVHRKSNSCCYSNFCSSRPCSINWLERFRPLFGRGLGSWPEAAESRQRFGRRIDGLMPRHRSRPHQLADCDRPLSDTKSKLRLFAISSSTERNSVSSIEDAAADSSAAESPTK